MLFEDDAAEADISQPATTTTTESKIRRIDGEGHHVTQAEKAYITINNYFKDGILTDDFRRGGGISDEENLDYSQLDDDTADGSNDTPIPSRDKISEEIAASSNDVTFVNAPGARSRVGSGALPRNSQEIEAWYYQELDERDRCFVNACAILHGATLRVIAEATRELYIAQKEKMEIVKIEAPIHPIQTGEAPVPLPTSLMPPSLMPESLTWIYLLGQQDERKRAMLTQANQVAESIRQPVVEVPAVPLHSLDSLLEKTHTYSAYTNGATRIFWKDTAPSGLSNFSLELLHFLAHETVKEDMYSTQPEQRFLDIVKQWPAKYRGERSWRSANALGVIWWHLDTRNLLWRQADKWAKSPQKQDWDHAAAVLDGAYQVERGTIRSANDENIKSLVLQLLETWTTTAHKWISTVQQGTTLRGEGYAAARAYALIGRKSPEVALRGLEQLLRFPSQPQNVVKSGRDPAEDLFIFGVLRYVDIAKSGHIRPLLKHLADGAARQILIDRPTRVRRGYDEEIDKSSSAALHVVLTAFFLLASCSLSAVDVMVPVTYDPVGSLPEYPTCPDNKGRDILLAGILTTAEDAWRNQLAMLLAALILEKNYPSAFYLMTRWGEIVLRNLGSDASSLETVYIQFLVAVGQQVRDWSNNKRPIAINIYKRQLTLWLTDKRLPHPRFKDLAQKVLVKLI